MKRTWKLLLLLAMILTVLCLVVACGEETPSGENPDDPSKPSTPPPSLGTVDTSELDFQRGENDMTWSSQKKQFSINYNQNKAFMLDASNITTDSSLARATIEFHYFSDKARTQLLAAFDAESGKKISGDDKYKNGFTDAGTYYVRVVCKMSGYDNGVKDVEFIIVASTAVNYLVGIPASVGDAVFNKGTNGGQFSSLDRNITLKAATLTSNTVGYKFRNWYLNADCTGDPITSFNADDPAIIAAISNGTLKLYAKFDECVPYPTFYRHPTEDTRVTEAPATIPAIPGYEDLPVDKVVLLDMSLVTKDSPVDLDYGYSTPKIGDRTDTIYGLTPAYAIQTENGEFILPWNDINDTLDTGERDADGKPVGGLNNYYANDNTFAGAINIYSLPRVHNYANYNTVEFWIYNANKSDTNTIGLCMYCDGDPARNMHTPIALDFAGWKKFSFNVADFISNTSSHTTNITGMAIFGTTEGYGGLPTDNANVCDDKNPNFIYFSSFYLTNTDTSNYKPVIADPSELLELQANIAAMTGKAKLSENDVTTYMTLNGTEGKIWDDLSISNASGLSKNAQRIFELAEAWNDKTLTCYRNSDLLDTIAAALNKLTDLLVVKVNAGTETSRNYRTTAYYITKTVNTISDYINTSHAKTWMVPVLHFVNSPIGEGETRIQSAYTYASAHMAMGNSRQFVDGMRYLIAAFSDNRITLSLNAADIMDAMQLVRALKDSAFIPAKVDKFVDDFFRWFYENIDVFLTEGTVPTEIADVNSYVDLETYLRGLFMIYDMASEATQAKFAAAVKFYAQKNSDLLTNITNAKYYDVEATALAEIQAHTATATAPSTATKVIRTWENIGQVYYRTEAGFILFDTHGGDPIIKGISSSMSSIDSERIYCTVVNDIVAIATDSEAIIVTAEGVTTDYYSNGYYAYTSADGKTNILISTADITENSAASANGSIARTEKAAVIVTTSVNADNSVSLMIYNLHGVRADIKVVLNGRYSMVGANNLYLVEDDRSGNTTTVTVLLTTQVDEKFTALRPSTEDVFEITLTPIN